MDQLSIQQGDTILIRQVAGEFLNQLRNWESKGRLTSAEVEASFLRARAMFTMRTPTEGIFRISFELRARFSLSHWDALLLAACKEAGVTTLYLEDMDPVADFDGLRIVDPFA